MYTAFLQTWKLLGLALNWHNAGTCQLEKNDQEYFVAEGLPSDVIGENTQWGLMRQRQERVANGKFPCGLCQKLKAVRGGAEVEWEAGKRREGKPQAWGISITIPSTCLFRAPPRQTVNHGRNAPSDCTNSSDIRLQLLTISRIKQPPCDFDQPL